MQNEIKSLKIEVKNPERDEFNVVHDELSLLDIDKMIMGWFEEAK